MHEGNGLLAATPQGTWSQAVVHEHYRAGAEKRFYTVQHLRGEVAPPVVRVGAPGGEPETEVSGDLLRPGRENSPGRAPQPGLCAYASQHLEALVRIGLYLAAGATRMAYMSGAMKLDPVACLARGDYDIAVLHGEWGDDEKGRAGVSMVQSFEDARRPQWIGAVVEGQRGPGVTWGRIKVRRVRNRSPFAAVPDSRFFRP